MRFLFLLLLSLTAHAQSFQYKLEGSFTTNATPGGSSPAMVNYSINWNETSTAIQGVYQDNYFSQGQPRTLSGTVSANGRAMNVILPQSISDVRQLTFQTAATGMTTGSISMNVSTRDNIGSVIDNANTFALATALPVNAPTAGQDDGSCVVGFGALAGMCGLYTGTFNEIRDNRERCNLLVGGNARLEMGVNTAFSLILNYVPGAINSYTHTIGSFPPNPQSSTINVSSRNCGDLVGTTFETGNCKTLNLNGTFIPAPTGDFAFTGVYSITDEVNSDSCSYTMSLTREVGY